MPLSRKSGKEQGSDSEDGSDGPFIQSLRIEGHEKSQTVQTSKTRPVESEFDDEGNTLSSMSP